MSSYTPKKKLQAQRRARKRTKQREKDAFAIATALKKRPLLELMLQAVASLYPKDTLVPGVSLAYLPNKEEFYGSICRYDTRDQQTHVQAQDGKIAACQRVPKQVLYSVTDKSLNEVINKLAAMWYSGSAPAIALVNKVNKKGGVK